MRTLDDFAYDCIAWWSPRSGLLTVDSILKRAQHNGYPEATRPDVVDALDRMVATGTVLPGWY